MYIKKHYLALIFLVFLFLIFREPKEEEQTPVTYSYQSDFDSKDSKCYVEDCTRSHGSQSLYCNIHSCGDEDCHELRSGNGTIYCDVHAEEYYREEEYKKCILSGCYSRRQSNGIYCYNHTCQQKDCYEKSEEDSKYCLDHDYAKKATPTPTPKVEKVKKEQVYPDDPYDVYEYSDAEDFYYDNYDDFDGIDDAEYYFDEAWDKID